MKKWTLIALVVLLCSSSVVLTIESIEKNDTIKSKKSLTKAPSFSSYLTPIAKVALGIGGILYLNSQVYREGRNSLFSWYKNPPSFASSRLKYILPDLTLLGLIGYWTFDGFKEFKEIRALRKKNAKHKMENKEALPIKKDLSFDEVIEELEAHYKKTKPVKKDKKVRFNDVVEEFNY